MIFSFENNIKSDVDGYEKLLSGLHEGLKSLDKKITLDFGYVYFVEANLCAVLGALIEVLESNGKDIEIINLRPRVENVLRKNNFLTQFGRDSLNDYYGTSIQYQKFDPNEKADDVRFNEYIRRQLLQKDEFPTHTTGVGKRITENIFELYENARTHGKCNAIHTCGQYFPNKITKPLHVTIVDRGINFKENVSVFLKKDIEACDAIEWAMKLGNTTKTGSTPGGLGLDVIFQFIKHNNGKIQIISSNGFWEWQNKEVISRKLKYSFQGTIATIRFNLNDQNSYYMENDITDLTDIF